MLSALERYAVYVALLLAERITNRNARPVVDTNSHSSSHHEASFR